MKGNQSLARTHSDLPCTEKDSRRKSRFERISVGRLRYLEFFPADSESVTRHISDVETYDSLIGARLLSSIFNN